MIKKINLILSLIGTITLSIFFIKKWYQIWIIPVCFLGIYLSLLVLFIMFVGICSLSSNKNKEYDEQSPFIYNLLVYTMEFLADIFRILPKKSNFDLIPHDRKYMLVYNHISDFDPMLITSFLRKDKIIQLSKIENFKKPICGRLIHRSLFLPIDRNNNKKALKSIIRASSFISNDRFSVSIAPEGTRNKENVNKLLPFREGCFHIALRSKCPIVIMECFNVQKARKRFLFWYTKVEFNVLRVLEYEEYKDLSTFEISEIVRKEIQDKIDSRNEKK